MTTDPLTVLHRDVSEANAVRVYALFSGGHDSLASTILASSHPLFAGVVHINTGIGIEDTCEFVRETCRAHGWPLVEVSVPDGTYERRCLRYGMPGGPEHHGYLYHVLKRQPLIRLLAAIRERDRLPRTARFALVTGIRHGESTRRMRLHPTPARLDANRVWVSPILSWSALNCADLIEQRGFSRNSVVDKLHRSGECLCGALADPQELDWIAFWYPESARRIRDLEHRCFALGLPYRWGNKPAHIPAPGQLWLPMCQSCETRWERTG